MSQLGILIRREYWEHRATFMILPAVVTAFVVIVSLVLLLGIYTDSIEVDVNADIHTDTEHHEIVIEDSSLLDLYGHQLSQLALLPEPLKEKRLDEVFTGISVLWFAILWVVIFFYLIGALYDERKDRSVLFWKSMPVSDWLTVASKLAAGLVLAPLIYLGFIMIGHLAIAVIATIGAVGQEVSIWEALWGPANFVGRWLGFLLMYGFIILWCLPFFGWLLLVSSWAKSAPLAWAVGVPLVIVVLESLFFSTSYIGDFLSEHSFSIQFWDHARELSRNMNLPEAMEFAGALIVGMAFLGLAVWQRGKADEI